MINTRNLDPDRLFGPEPPPRSAARERYDRAADPPTTGLADEEDAPETVHELAYGLAREPYLPEAEEQPVRSAR